jgi:hypothetical protein
MDIKRTQEKKKKKTLKPIRKYQMYKISKNNLHVNDIDIDTYTPIFRTL